MSEFFFIVRSYLHVYKATFMQFWHQLTPQQYASILMAVALIGFLTMGSKPR